MDHRARRGGGVRTGDVGQAGVEDSPKKKWYLGSCRTSGRVRGSDPPLRKDENKNSKPANSTMPGRNAREMEKCLKEMQCVYTLSWMGIALRLIACSKAPSPLPSISRAPFLRSPKPCRMSSIFKYQVERPHILWTSNKTKVETTWLWREEGLETSASVKWLIDVYIWKVAVEQ